MRLFLINPSGHGHSRRKAVLLVLVIVLLGCHPRSAEEIAADRARVLGTWEYHTRGISALQSGTLRIRVQDGELVGRLRDRWRGTVRAQVALQGTRMELDLDRVRITGRLEQNRFRGTVQTPFWDASRAHAGRQASSGYFVARQVRSQSVVDDLTDLGCPSLLRESSYTCSPLVRP
jgi:hypothetical protein